MINRLPILLTSTVYKMAYISAKNASLDLKFSPKFRTTLESLWWSLLSKWKRITLNAPTTPPLGGTKWARLHDILYALSQFLREIITLPNALQTPSIAHGSAFGKWPSVATPLFSVFFFVVCRRRSQITIKLDTPKTQKTQEDSNAYTPRHTNTRSSHENTHPLF